MKDKKHIGKVAVVKIAPGRNAVYWDQCLKEGYICVGWDEMGDLRRYRNRAEFQKSFERIYGPLLYQGRLATLRQKGNELWTITQMRPGDKVIANRGMSEVLGIGVVQEPGYLWRPTKTRDGHYHTVRVTWDTSFAKRIPKQPWNQTVAQVGVAAFNRITSSQLSPDRTRKLNQSSLHPLSLDTNPLNIRSPDVAASEKAEQEVEKSQGFQSNPRRNCVMKKAAKKKSAPRKRVTFHTVFAPPPPVFNATSMNQGETGRCRTGLALWSNAIL
jgi:hypothetical protein